ncbi:nucleotidyltransferase family protein [Neobacillus sp. BF23-41]|uniref:nucleotidyltransferase family protein n=1 Tax=Neobacillus sp. BF23-41 TaxID=3240280 RepID=UPI0034E58808
MEKYEDTLLEIVNKSEPLRRVFKVLQHSELPFDYYIGAGCITNTVWNYQSGFPLKYGISDVDVVYYDGEDLSPESEQKYRDELVCKLGDFPFKLDVKNEAGVHLWYEKKFGFSIKPYKSLKTAIDSWPTTATALGIRKEQTGSYKIYAPYKLDEGEDSCSGCSITQENEKITATITWNDKTETVNLKNNEKILH